MGLKDELNAASRDKSVVRDEQYKKDYEDSYKNAEFAINGIQDELMQKAEHGEYSELTNGKKYIQIDYQSSTLKYYMGLHFKIEKVIDDEDKNEAYFVKYYIGNQGYYDGFVKRLMEFSLQEDVSFKIICKRDRDGKMVEFNPVIGEKFAGKNIRESEFTIYIECSVEY